MTDTTPTPVEIAAEAARLFATVPPATLLLGDIGATSYAITTGVADSWLQADDRDPVERIRRVRLALAAREPMAELWHAARKAENEASRTPDVPPRRRIRAAAVHKTADLLAGLECYALTSAGREVECGIHGKACQFARDANDRIREIDREVRENPGPIVRDAGRTNPPSDTGPDPAWLADRQRRGREAPYGDRYGADGD